ncbi:MAG: hypothetical protein ABI776_04155 [Nocardioidaceae bacterium]
MRVYTGVWVVCWSVLALPAMLFGFASWTADSTTGVFALSGLLCATTVAVHDPRRGVSRRRSRDLALVAVRRCLFGGAVAVAVSVAASSLGTLTLPLLVMAGVTSPWLLVWVLAQLPRRTPPAAATPLSPDPADRPARSAEAAPAPEHVQLSASHWDTFVRSLSDQELCSSWRVSYTFVVSASATVTGVELVNLRQAYLDELERRNPRGVQAWLAHGARAAGDPTRHLAARPYDRLPPV